MGLDLHHAAPGPTTSVTGTKWTSMRPRVVRDTPEICFDAGEVCMHVMDGTDALALPPWPAPPAAQTCGRWAGGFGQSGCDPVALARLTRKSAAKKWRWICLDPRRYNRRPALGLLAGLARCPSVEFDDRACPRIDRL
ncbi:MAG TPA: hypothetical protein VMC10_09275 [Stellaceae bacterium]|nr:hypothetical protein [Stellaceae bacterium]